MNLADMIEKEIEAAVKERRAGDAAIPMLWSDDEWRQIVAALRVADAEIALEDAGLCSCPRGAIRGCASCSADLAVGEAVSAYREQAEE